MGRKKIWFIILSFLLFTFCFYSRAGGRSWFYIKSYRIDCIIMYALLPTVWQLCFLNKSAQKFMMIKEISDFCGLCANTAYSNKITHVNSPKKGVYLSLWYVILVFFFTMAFVCIMYWDISVHGSLKMYKSIQNLHNKMISHLYITFIWM